MAKITIDGVEADVQEGINCIEAAKAADIHVPHFCYHPSLSVVGQCRMCLVEIEGMPKLQAGCSTTVKEGMKIHVWNDKVDEARKGQMEFLLINHPLDCPICDKAGECPLQDYAFNYGSVASRYGEFKRTYPGMDRTAIGPHVVQNMNRCIHCTRCIRFTSEITETGELGFFKRGASTEVGVFPGTPLNNWMSACVTDVCPTGALTTREFRFESRVWNLESAESVCNGCDVGCNIFIGFRQGQIFRYRPRVNPEVNDHWLCDFGRFSYERYDTDRVVVPKVRNDDEYLGISTWTEALDAIGTAVRGAKKTAAIFSANMTNEEASFAKAVFVENMGAAAGVMVDPIEPIKMKSRTEWIVGTQAAPNYRGVAAVLGVGSGELGVGATATSGNSDTRHPTPDPLINDLLTTGADNIDVLFITDANFSERAKDPAVVSNLRKAKFLVVMSWDANHPLNDVADVLIPSTIHAEKEGTFTNLQGRVQRIHQAYPPKGQAVSDAEVYRRIGAMLYPDAAELRTLDHIPELPVAEAAAVQA
ncbi:MAG TPA: 2Fe-2S iron-sulfur cluster-binding protein [Thermoanaerobaculia bacterium]|jgi:NADH-quinone oxidoreductase subunit G|nr:2Fe-2S iron-sulfur cluster-binding protein [Thermoanaerobaculia bacterium]